MGVAGLTILAVFVFVALFADVLVPEARLSVTNAPGAPLEPPSSQFWLGTDELGRSVLDLVIQGSQISLLVGFLATGISMLIGSLVGITAGYFGGWVDVLLMRFTDWFLVIPFLPLAIVLAAILGRSLFVIAFVIGIITWPGTARVVRAQVLTLKERPYVERARALGASNRQIIGRHILPNVFPLIFANTILVVAVAISPKPPLLPGAGRPLQRLLGQHPGVGLRGGRHLARRLVVPGPAGPVHRSRGARLHHVRLRLRRDPRPQAAKAMSETPRHELLEIKNLRVLYEVRGKKAPAVDGVDLSLGAGDALGLAGESGCGKSTLALACLGLASAQRDGRGVDPLSRTRRSSGPSPVGSGRCGGRGSPWSSRGR